MQKCSLYFYRPSTALIAIEAFWLYRFSVIKHELKTHFFALGLVFVEKKVFSVLLFMLVFFVFFIKLASHSMILR